MLDEFVCWEFRIGLFTVLIESRVLFEELVVYRLLAPLGCVLGRLEVDGQNVGHHVTPLLETLLTFHAPEIENLLC